MDENVRKALEMFKSGFNCAQAVAGSFNEDLGIDDKVLMKIACGFGGGMRCGEVCGAVSGAVMVIGLKYGQSDAGDTAAKGNCYKITSEYIEKYKKRNGTILCREILGYDVRDARDRAKNPGRQKEVCPKAIETAVLLLKEMGF